MHANLDPELLAECMPLVGLSHATKMGADSQCAATGQSDTEDVGSGRGIYFLVYHHCGMNPDFPEVRSPYK